MAGGTSIRFDIDRAALTNLVNASAAGLGMLRYVATAVRDDARRNARPISSKTDAIVANYGADALGAYADVGYMRHHPGWFLWFYEIGTRQDAPRPHLRPALRGDLVAE